jgi:hypothetical protein
VFSLLGSLKYFGEEAKFVGAQYDLGHIESNSKLRFSDKARSKFVEISEEFSYSDPVLSALVPDPGQDIVHINWSVLQDFSFLVPRLVPGHVIKALIVVKPHSEDVNCRVNMVAEVEIIDFINISLVHVASQDNIQNVIWSWDSQLGQHSQELHLSHMAISGNVKVLELGFQVDSPVLDFLTVRIQYFLNSLII